MNVHEFLGKPLIQLLKESMRAALRLDLGFQEIIDELAAAVFNADGLCHAVFADGELLAAAG